MSTGTNFMNFENLNKLIEEHKKETHHYKNYEFDNTNYTLLLVDINNLLKENQELKKQVEETDRKLFFTKNELDMREKSIDNKLNQQKEFIKYLEDENTKFDIKANGMGASSERDELITKARAYREILQKHKEIIGVEDEKNIK